MSTDNNNIKHYSAEDIARYWQRKLSPQEMHAMEMAAMDDPFLADAMEGYTGMNELSVKADVHELQQRLQERANGAKVVPMKTNRGWWRVAAAIILLGGAGALTYTLFNQKEINKLSTATVNKKTDTPAVSGYDALSSQSNKDTANSGYRVSLSDTQRFYSDTFRSANGSALGQNNYSSTITEPNTLQKPVASDGFANSDTLGFARKSDDRSKNLLNFKKELEKDSVVIAQGEAKDNDNIAKTLQGRAAGIQVQTPKTSNQQPPATVPNWMENGDQAKLNDFRGRVLDKRNAPIANATVRVNNNAYLATDQQGNFLIKSVDTALNLSVNSVGYEQRDLVLRNNQPKDIVLDESVKQMEEVVVTGYGTQKRKSVASSNAELKVYVMDAQPVMGWDEYKNYIDKNKRSDSAGALPKGDVVVSFMVGKTGKLSSFEIEKSLGKLRDAEAIHLIKQGPPWKVLKGKKTRARIIITF